jgi:hypothetical protein
VTGPIRSTVAAGLVLALVALRVISHDSGRQVHVNRPGLVARMILGVVGAARTRG